MDATRKRMVNFAERVKLVDWASKLGCWEWIEFTPLSLVWILVDDDSRFPLLEWDKDFHPFGGMQKSLKIHMKAADVTVDSLMEDISKIFTYFNIPTRIGRKGTVGVATPFVDLKPSAKRLTKMRIVALSKNGWRIDGDLEEILSEKSMFLNYWRTDELMELVMRPNRGFMPDRLLVLSRKVAELIEKSRVVKRDVGVEIGYVRKVNEG